MWASGWSPGSRSTSWCSRRCSCARPSTRSGNGVMMSPPPWTTWPTRRPAGTPRGSPGRGTSGGSATRPSRPAPPRGTRGRACGANPRARVERAVPRPDGVVLDSLEELTARTRAVARVLLEDAAAETSRLASRRLLAKATPRCCGRSPTRSASWPTCDLRRRTAMNWLASPAARTTWNTRPGSSPEAPATRTPPGTLPTSAGSSLMNWPENQTTATELRWGPVDQHQDDRHDDRKRASTRPRRRTVAAGNH